jgi:hypothetical protein
MGLKTIDNFEELNLNPDLLRGIYGNFTFIQLSDLKNPPSFNKKEYYPSSAKKIASLRHSQVQVKPPLSPSESFNFSTPNHLNHKPSSSHLPDNSPNKSTKSSSASVSSSTSTLAAASEELIPAKTERPCKVEEYK